MGHVSNAVDAIWQAQDGKARSSLCPPDLLRLSAGIEDVEDLWRDLDRALNG